jgi:hypothetical protein
MLERRETSTSTIDTNPAFDSDFSYDFYARLLQSVGSRFRLRPLRDFQVSGQGEPVCYVRHDIDLCLDAAVALAEVERASGVSATYMFIPTSTLYDITSSDGAAALRQIQALGHEVAIHFDVLTSGISDPGDRDTLLKKIDEQCDIISGVTGEDVASVSFHRPLSIFLHGPDRLGSRVNAYSSTLMGFYRSDSGGRWRSGNPVADFGACNANVAQLLTHPIWWRARHDRPSRRLNGWFEAKTARFSSQDRQRFDELLSETVPGVTRAN